MKDKNIKIGDKGKSSVAFIMPCSGRLAPEERGLKAGVGLLISGEAYGN